jgi:hypothetical protein
MLCTLLVVQGMLSGWQRDGEFLTRVMGCIPLRKLNPNRKAFASNFSIPKYCNIGVKIYPKMAILRILF